MKQNLGERNSARRSLHLSAMNDMTRTSIRSLGALAVSLLALLATVACSSGESDATGSDEISTADGDRDPAATTVDVQTDVTVDSAEGQSDRSEVESSEVESSETTQPAVIVPPNPDALLEAAAEVLGSGIVLEAHDMAVESSGVHLRVERIEQRSDATFIRLAIVNGADEEREVPHQNEATLTTADGVRLQPTAAFPARSRLLEPGESDIVVLVYPSTKGPFDLQVGLKPDSPFTRQVGFRFDGLDPAATLGGLPEDAALRATETHPNGSQFELDGIRFTPDRIGVGVEVRNGADWDLWIFGADETFLEDDLGNRYRSLVEPNGRTFFEMAPESSLDGVLTFVGRMDPRASSFRIFINDGGLLTNSLARSPAFVFGPFDLGAEQTVAVPENLDLDQVIDNPSGSMATLSAVRFDDETIRAEVTIINNTSDETADYNGALTYLVDSEGITYQSQIEELPELILGPGEGFQGEIVFSGQLQPGADTVRITIGRGLAFRHSFFFDPIEVNRVETVVSGLTDFDVPDVSVFSLGSLETTSVEEIAGAIAEFDGREVEGGVLLTLPDAILFDFGESTLRPDAASSIALVADILEFFEGDDVLIVGHTDSIGDEASNITLSVDRATAVLDGLVLAGVDPNLLDIDGRGEAEPVAPNAQADGSDDPAGRQLNRRVEIFIETELGIPEG